MFLVYWKARVGSAIHALADSLALEHDFFDDRDENIEWGKYEYIIPSPGIPPSHKLYQQSIPIVAELDFAARYLPETTKIVAITGTDGKSTTAWITWCLLSRKFTKDRVYLSWNFEIPLSHTVMELRKKHQNDALIVLEVSSFMAYNIETFHPDFTVFTNFQADHLNWHGTLEEYFLSKWNLITHTKHEVFLNEQITFFLRELSSTHSTNLQQNISYFWNSKTLSNRIEMPMIFLENEPFIHIHQTHFSGYHNACNILSASLLALKVGVSRQECQQYLTEITGLEHRIETIWIFRGIECIDDSKSTSCQSLCAAINSFVDLRHRHVSLIIGGSDKGDTFDGLASTLQESTVKHAIIFWQTWDLLESICQKAAIPFTRVSSMKEAVAVGFTVTPQGGILLLSPGCASFDMFVDYLDRAQQFRNNCLRYDV